MMRFLILATAAALIRADGTGHGISKSTYACNDPIAAAAWLKKFLPVEEANDDCNADEVCQCDTNNNPWDIEQGRVALKLETTNLGISRGFGLHLVNVSARETGPALSLGSVEAAFAARLGNLSAFDAFMDFNVGLYTTNLRAYTDAFDRDGETYLLMSWPLAGKTWYSAVFLVPGSAMVVELISSNFTAAAGLDVVAAAAPRLGAPPAAAAGLGYLYPIRVGRATTSLAAVDAFYAAAFPSAARVVETATRHCYKFENASTVDVCYTLHSDDAKAPLSVAALEQGFRAGHDANLRNKPKCGRDKWLDFHFAYDNPAHGDAAVGDAVVAYADAAPDALYACEANPRPSGPRGLILHYVVDPTGWGIQYGGPYTTAPKACANATLRNAPFGDVYNPAFDLGTC